MKKFIFFLAAVLSAGCSCGEQSRNDLSQEKVSEYTDPFRDCTVLMAAAAENYALVRYGSSAAACTEALSIQPALKEALVLRAVCLTEFGDFKGAERDLDEAVHSAPDWSTVWTAKGRLKHLSGNFVQAAEDYTRALVLDSKNFRDRYNRGLVYAAMGKFREAAEDMNRFLCHHPDSGQAWAARAEDLFALGKINQALADCTLALEKNPDSAAAWACRSRIYLKKGFAKKADYCFRKAAALFRPGQVPSDSAELKKEISALSGKNLKNRLLSDGSGGAR